MNRALSKLILGLAVALGLTLIYGVMKILNIAHGSLYALGAYLAATLVGAWLAGDSGQLRGEFVLVIGRSATAEAKPDRAAAASVYSTSRRHHRTVKTTRSAARLRSFLRSNDSRRAAIGRREASSASRGNMSS